MAYWLDPPQPTIERAYTTPHRIVKIVDAESGAGVVLYGSGETIPWAEAVALGLVADDPAGWLADDAAPIEPPVAGRYAQEPDASTG